MPPSRSRGPAPSGLRGLRRSGSVTELLFLFDCETMERAHLRPIAEELGLTVQAASHVFRELRRRGLVTVRDGRYRPTVEGVAWLHDALLRVADDTRERLDRLYVIRSCRAVAASRLVPGETASLEISDGLLTARGSASGASRGKVVRGGAAGSLVEIGDLEGIVPIRPAPITVRTLTEADLTDPDLGRRLAAALPPEGALLAADGLEAYLSLRRSTDRPIVRFAAGEACREASVLGVSSCLVIMARDLPRVLTRFAGPSPPSLEVLPLGPARRRPSRGVRRSRRSDA